MHAGCGSEGGAGVQRVGGGGEQTEYALNLAKKDYKFS